MHRREHVEPRDRDTTSSRAAFQASRGEESRARLLAQLSHAVRVQMQAVTASSSALRRLRAEEVLLHDAARILARSARRMNALLDDLLDLVSVQCGTLRLERETTVLQPLVECALRAQRGPIEHRRLRVVCSMPAQEVVLACDPARVLRVVTQVLSHTIERTPPGGEILLRCMSSDGQVELEITDVAPSMPKEAQSILVEPWLRVRPTEAPALGLQLASALVEAQGGRFVHETFGDARNRSAIILPR